MQIMRGTDGALWFTEDLGRIGRVTVSGVMSEYQVPTPDAHPIGLAAAPDGSIWFCESNTNKVGRLVY